jgi:hypothetical protein
MGLQCSWDPADFSAQDFYEFNRRQVRITGHGTCPAAGYSVTLEPDPDNDDHEQHVMAVKLTETTAEAAAEGAATVLADTSRRPDGPNHPIRQANRNGILSREARLLPTM